MRRYLLSFLRLARPLFLAGGFVFYALGAAIARYQGAPLNVAALVWGQATVTAGQLMTHFSNEYFDLRADRANPTPTRWAGGSRVLAEGTLPPWVALAAAAACAVAALAATVVAGALAGPWAAAVLALALVMAWSYSAPPLRLHSRGLGEPAAALILPVLTPLAGYSLQTGQPGALPLLAAVPLACFQAAMILILNFPDAAGDHRAGKRTLVLHLGLDQAARLHPALLAAGYALLPLLVIAGLPPVVAGVALIPLPLAVWLATRMSRGAWRDPAAWDGLAFWSIGLLMSTAALELLAFWV